MGLPIHLRNQVPGDQVKSLTTLKETYFCVDVFQASPFESKYHVTSSYVDENKRVNK